LLIFKLIPSASAKFPEELFSSVLAVYAFTVPMYFVTPLFMHHFGACKYFFRQSRTVLKWLSRYNVVYDVATDNDVIYKLLFFVIACFALNLDYAFCNGFVLLLVIKMSATLQVISPNYCIFDNYYVRFFRM